MIPVTTNTFIVQADIRQNSFGSHNLALFGGENCNTSRKQSSAHIAKSLLKIIYLEPGITCQPIRPYQDPYTSMDIHRSSNRDEMALFGWVQIKSKSSMGSRITLSRIAVLQCSVLHWTSSGKIKARPVTAKVENPAGPTTLVTVQRITSNVPLWAVYKFAS